jgi:hypothetical protein
VPLAPRRRPPTPGPPGPGGSALALPVGRALDSHASLTGLLARVRASDARLAAILPTLPAGLAGAVRAGPLDDKAWVLLAEHAAAAARLRHCLSDIEATLAAAGWHEPRVVIKVRPRS